MTEEELAQKRAATIEAEDQALAAASDAKEIMEHPRIREVSKKLQDKYEKAMLDAKTDDDRRTAQAMRLCQIEFLREFRAMLEVGVLATSQRSTRETHEASLRQRTARK